jgi:hypothetical protein
MVYAGFDVMNIEEIVNAFQQRVAKFLAVVG